MQLMREFNLSSKLFCLSYKSCFGGKQNLFKVMNFVVKYKQNPGKFPGFHVAGLTEDNHNIFGYHQ